MNDTPDGSEELRLNRYLAQCGLGARRKCDEFIASGHVYVNGQKVVFLGTKVTASDVVEYRGRTVKPLRKLEYWAFNKPQGVLVSRTDPDGRKTVYDALIDAGISGAHLNYVGRLDYASEGLLLLTNDGALIHALTHPRFKIKKSYHVEINRLLIDEDRVKMLTGIESEEQTLTAGAVKRTGGTVKGFWYEIDLYEGKNRQLRRMFESMTYQVLRLRRIQFASVKLDDLAEGAVRPLTEKEVAALLRTGFKDTHR